MTLSNIKQQNQLIIQIEVSHMRELIHLKHGGTVLSEQIDRLNRSPLTGIVQEETQC